MMRLLGVASYVLNNGPGSFFLWRDESRSESELSQFEDKGVKCALSHKEKTRNQMIYT